MRHMDTTHADLYENHQRREAYWAAKDAAHAGRPLLVAAPTGENRSTDAMNTEAIRQLLVDIALTRRATARLYTRKRWALRELVRMGVFTPEEARGKLPPLVNLLSKWRALRGMRRELTTC